MRFLRMGVVVVCLIFLVIHFQQKQQETSVLFPMTVEGLTGPGAASAVDAPRPAETPVLMLPLLPPVVSPPLGENIDTPIVPPPPLEDVPALRRKLW